MAYDQGGFPAIQLVTRDWCAKMREMHTQLVRAPRFGDQMHQGIAVFCAERHDVRDCNVAFIFGAHLAEYNTLRLAAYAGFQHRFPLYCAANDGIICFLDLAASHRARELSSREGVLCHQNST